jgi:hypothetical protein
VLQLVDESARAWHAGASWWGGSTDLNSASIGIELDNTGEEPFAEPQIAALLVLLDELRTRHRIPAANVSGPRRRGADAQGRSQPPVPLAAPGAAGLRPLVRDAAGRGRRPASMRCSGCRRWATTSGRRARRARPSAAISSAATATPNWRPASRRCCIACCRSSAAARAILPPNEHEVALRRDSGLHHQGRFD